MGSGNNRFPFLERERTMMTAFTEIILIHGIPAESLFSTIGIFIVSLFILYRGIYHIRKGKQIREYGTVYNAQALSKRYRYKDSIFMTVMYTDKFGNKKMTEVISTNGAYHSGKRKGFVQVIEFGSETYEYHYSPAPYKGVLLIILAVILIGMCGYMLKDSMI